MTAEIAILNKHAVALAADSTVTIGIGGSQRRKTYQSANKLFTLSKYQPVGAMIFGNAGIMGVPWETVIKLYRKNLAGRCLPSVSDYADDFIRFLENSRSIFPESLQQDHVAIAAHVCCMGIWEMIKSRVEKATEDEKATEEKVGQIAKEVIDQRWHHVSKVGVCKYLDDEFESKLLQSYEDAIGLAVSEALKMPLPEESLQTVHRIVARLICGEWFPESMLSGVVFAGFGEDQIFPEVRTVSPHIIVNNRLMFRAEDGESYVVNHDENAALLPFAQRDVVDAFLRGIDSEYMKIVTEAMDGLSSHFPLLIADHLGEKDPDKKAEIVRKLTTVTKQLADGLSRQLHDYRDREHVNPLLAVIGTLPKNELAELAEALVNLTSVKRKMSHDLETVGGPIDVAVISKGDGFIWIRRKHYFKTELNPHFIRNYSREDDHAGSPKKTRR